MTDAQRKRFERLLALTAAGALCSLRDLPPCPSKPEPKPLACYPMPAFYGWPRSGGAA